MRISARCQARASGNPAQDDSLACIGSLECCRKTHCQSFPDIILIRCSQILWICQASTVESPVCQKVLLLSKSSHMPSGIVLDMKEHIATLANAILISGNWAEIQSCLCRNVQDSQTYNLAQAKCLSFFGCDLCLLGWQSIKGL